MPLGARVLIVDPGAFRTNFLSAMRTFGVVASEYEGTVVQQLLSYRKNVESRIGQAEGDVQEGFNAIFDVIMKRGLVEGMDEFLRLLLGKNGSARWKIKLEDLQKSLDRTEIIWSKTDYDD